MSIDFSIIIPAKNEAENINQCLDSITAMDFDRERYEIILIDNGSNDDTVAIAKRKGAHVFVQPDLNISGLRNFGARQAHGRVLAFLDADCTVAQNWLRAASCYLNDTQHSCFGSAPIIPENATWVQKTWFNIRKKESLITWVDWLESMNMFIRKDLFSQIKGFNEDLVTCEDYELCTRLKFHGKILSDQRIIAVHHGEAATLKHFFIKERWRATNNYRGLNQRQVELSEWPGIILPLVQLFLSALFCLLALTTILNITNFAILILYILIWQLPLLALTIYKIKNKPTLKQTAQLHILLNLYLFARGCAIF